MNEQSRIRLPGEWERQRATLLAWPSANSDWTSRLEAVRAEYLDLIRTIGRIQPVLVLVSPLDQDDLPLLADLPGVLAISAPFNDTWCRDYGPITVSSDQGGHSFDFFFNGWGGKYDARLDNSVNEVLSAHCFFAKSPFSKVSFELEGGAIESDGRGSLLVNWHCLRTRHPSLTQTQIADRLCAELGLSRVIGIDIEPTEGDDTDGHIDTLARFLSTDTIAWQVQREANRTRLIESQLRALRQPDGQPYRLVELPCPEGFDPDLPANYANFLFINGACLVPAYGVPADDAAIERLSAALPDRPMIKQASVQLIHQFGSIHCATMHIPE